MADIYLPNKSNPIQLAEKKDIVNPNLFSYYDVLAGPASIDFSDIVTPILNITSGDLACFNPLKSMSSQANLPISLSFEAKSKGSASSMQCQYFGGKLFKNLDLTDQWQRFEVHGLSGSTPALFFGKKSGEDIQVQKIKLEYGSYCTVYNRNWQDIYQLVKSKLGG